jgi:L-amino acid N-acyltransferase YncA
MRSRLRSLPRPVLNTRVEIRQFAENDWPEVWAIVHAVIEAGDTYEYPPGSTEAEGRDLWIRPSPAECWVAVEDGRVLGTYKISANRLGLADHVANGSYMVSAAAQGRGLGRALCEHSLERARALGFQAMQFNAVVATNTRALRLWRSCGFIIVGTVPNGFRLRGKDMVDYHILHRFL